MAGISLCYRALNSGIWRGKKIAIIDPNFNAKDDKAWCFWENNEGPFESIIYKKWKELQFFTHSGKNLTLDNGDYHYKMLRSIDFKNHCIDFLNQQTNVHFSHKMVEFGLFRVIFRGFKIGFSSFS